MEEIICEVCYVDITELPGKVSDYLWYDHEYMGVRQYAYICENCNESVARSYYG